MKKVILTNRERRKAHRSLHPQRRTVQLVFYDLTSKLNRWVRRYL